MVTINVRIFPKMTVQDGSTHIPKARLDVINPIAEKQEAKGLDSMMTKSREIMRVHLDIVKDEQWESSKPELKGKSCNAISLITDDEVVILASLSGSKEEKLSSAALYLLVIGTQTGK